MGKLITDIMYTAKYIKTIAGIDTWFVYGHGESFYTDFSVGHSKEQIEDFYNN